MDNLAEIDKFLETYNLILYNYKEIYQAINKVHCLRNQNVPSEEKCNSLCVHG